jgi:predicted transcriptional regulator of viral defense system
MGGLIALTLHRLTDQQHASLIDAFVLRRRKQRIIANATVRFHASKANRIVVGTTHVQVENVAVSVSDPEKTLLDALDYAEPFGGLREGVRLVSRSLDRIEPAVLIDYALKLSPMSTLQRLGVLLERTAVMQTQLDVLAARIRGTSNKPTMVPGPRTGTLNPTWHVIENDLATDKHSPASTTRSR